MKKMKITLRKDGTQKIEVLNAVGDECVAFTRELEARLGVPAGERELKAEYHESEAEVVPEHETGQ